MSKVSITKSKLDALATAVSVKSGVATPITIDEMTTAVANIQTGGNTFLITLSYNDQTEMYEPDCTWSDVCDAYYAGKTVLTYNAEWMTGIYIEEFSFDPEWDKDDTVIWLDVIFWDDNDGKKYDGVYIWSKTEYVLDANIEQIEPIFDSPSVTYTPTESQQTDTITYDSTLGYNGIEEVNIIVNAIPSNYVGSGVSRKSSSDLTASGATVTAPAGYYENNATKTVASMTLPTTTSGSATSGYTSTATVSRSTSDQYINIPTGYNSAGAYYKVNAVANGSATPASSISGTSATVTTGNNTLTLSKTVSNTPQVSAGYVSSGTAGNSNVSLTASVTTKAAATITPTTTNQTITSGTYLTGTQTISGDTNLVAGNIKSGTTIFGVTGTYTGGGGGGVNIDTKTVTASNRPSSLSFTSMKGEPKVWFLKATFTMTSSSTTYYYVDSMCYDGTDTTGRLFRMGSTRQTENVASGYSFTYSGTTLTVSSTGTRTASPGCFYNGSYELVYVY